MFKKLEVRNNLKKLIWSNFSLYRIILICFFIYCEIKDKSRLIERIPEVRSEIIIADILLLVVLPLIISIIIVRISHSRDKAKNKKLSEEYYREILNEVSCTELSFLDDNNIEFKKDIVATLLELNLKKKIKFENEKIVVIDKKTTWLTKHERYVLNKLIESDKSLLINNHSIIGKIKGLIKRFSNINSKKDIVKNDGFEIQLFNDLKKSKIIDSKAGDKSEKRYKKIRSILLITAAILIICLGSGELDWAMSGAMIIVSAIMIYMFVKFSSWYEKYLDRMKNKNWFVNICNKICVIALMFIIIIITSCITTAGIMLADWAANPRYYEEVIITLKYVFLSIVLAIIIVDAIMIVKNKRLLTSKGEDIKRKLCGLKSFLKDFSMMKDRKLEEVDMWNEYFIYSVVLNENKKITRKVWKMLKNTIGNN